jgi:hypothetical protein
LRNPLQIIRVFLSVEFDASFFLMGKEKQRRYHLPIYISSIVELVLQAFGNIEVGKSLP